MESLIFKSLSDEISSTPPLHPISYGVVILDEADAILLDHAKQEFSIVHPLKGQSFNWKTSIEISKDLVEGKDIIANKKDRSANLTIEGEARIKNILRLGKSKSSEFLLIRHSIEICYVAIHIVEKYKDYIIENEGIYPIDQLTGAVRRGQIPYWIMPLEYLNGYDVRTRNITLNSVAPETFLAYFEHVSGLSGTIKEDSLEYFFGYQLPTVIIPPRVPRQKGLEDDLVYLTSAEACKHAYMEAKWVNNNGQPVLIGTNNIHDAERLFRIFQEEPPELKPKLLTGRNDHAISEIFAGAGRSNSIIIATQLADRGIDIRLTEESKKNGGLHLISIGHALTTRHDRQFLGRAGRQGDPWSARFFCSLEDPLFKIFAPQWVSKMMESLGIEAEEAVEHPWVTKAIKNAQQKLREHDFWIGRQQSYLNLAFSEVQPHAKVWFEQARYFVQFDEHADDLEANLTFASIDWLIDRYIETNFLSMLNNVRDVNYDTAKTIVALINNSFASANIKLLAEGDLEGRTGEKARLMIRKWLQNVLRRKIQTATLLKSDWNKNLFEFFEESELLPKEIEKLYAKFAQENNEEPIIHESVTLDDIVHTNIVENRLLACKSKRLFMDSRLVLGAESRFG